MSPEEKAARPPLQALLPALKPALIFECVGVPGLIQQVFEGAPRDARIVVVGVCMETDRSEPMLGILKELNVQYVLGYTPEEFAYSLRLIAEGQVDAASMVTATRRHRRCRQGVCRSRQSGSAHQDHRRAVAVDVPERFRPSARAGASALPRAAELIAGLDLARRFRQIYQTNLWGAATPCRDWARSSTPPPCCGPNCLRCSKD